MGLIYQKTIEGSTNFKLRSELNMISDIEDLRRDPIGNSIYLYFLLKNSKRGPDVDALIYWMNE